MKNLSKSLIGCGLIGTMLWSCNKDEEISPVASECFPTTVPLLFKSENFGMKLKYNEKDIISGYYLMKDDKALDSPLFSVIYNSSGKLASVQFDSSMYYTFKYEGNKIIEKVGKTNDPDKATDDRFNVYILDNQGRITGVEDHDIDYGVKDIRYKETFKYDQRGNIVEIYGEDLIEGDKDTVSIEYDNHPNPHHAVGFTHFQESLLNYFSISVNNPTRIFLGKENYVDIQYEL